jgi:hypothetical protein
MPMMLDIGLTVAVKLGSVQTEPAVRLARSKIPVGQLCSAPQAHRTSAELCLTQAPPPTTEPIGIKPLALSRHFTKLRLLVLIHLTFIAYKLDVLGCLQTAAALHSAAKYEYCS